MAMEKTLYKSACPVAAAFPCFMAFGIVMVTAGPQKLFPAVFFLRHTGTSSVVFFPIIQSVFVIVEFVGMIIPKVFRISIIIYVIIVIVKSRAFPVFVGFSCTLKIFGIQVVCYFRDITSVIRYRSNKKGMSMFFPVIICIPMGFPVFPIGFVRCVVVRPKGCIVNVGNGHSDERDFISDPLLVSLYSFPLLALHLGKILRFKRLYARI